MKLPGALRILSGNILVFAISDLLGNIGRGMVFPYASLYVLALGGDAAQIGLIGFLGQLAGLVFLPVAGHITDHADRIRLIGIAGLLSSIFVVMMALAPGWQTIAAASLLMGMVVFQFPAYASLVADSLPANGRGMGLGLQNTVSSSLAVFAPYIAGLVIQQYSANLGMRILYGAMALLNAVSAIAMLRFLKEASHAPRDPLHFNALLRALTGAYRSIPGMLRQMPSSLRGLALVVVLSLCATALTGPFWVVYATDQLGLNAQQWGLILLLESLLRVLLFMPAGLLVDRWGRVSTLTLALAISVLTTPLFILLHSFGAVLAIRMLQAFAFVLAIPSCSALMADLVPKRVRGQLMAALGQGGILPGMIGSPGGPAVGYLIIPPLMLASLAGGYLYHLNPAYPWIGSTLAGAAAVGLLVFWVRDPHQAEV